MLIWRFTHKRGQIFNTAVYRTDRSHTSTQSRSVPDRLDQIPRSQSSIPTSDWGTIDPIDSQCWSSAAAPGHLGIFWSLEVQLIPLIPIVSHLALVPVLRMFILLAICYHTSQYFKYLTEVLSLLMQQKQCELHGIWLKIPKTASSERLTNI